MLKSRERLKKTAEIHPQNDWLLEEERFKKTASQSIHQFLKTTREKTVDSGREIITMTNAYINKSPSLKTFVYSTAVLSAIPLGIFSAFLGITLFFSICTAIMGVLIVQSGAVLIGGAFLLPIEAGILCIAGGATVVGYVTGASNLLISKQPKIQPKLERYESLLLKEAEVDENNTIII